MKVLFAVHDENVSASIVKKYQREYKEIISYKNVYYYNAILKELQRDKSYDRIIIDEELEEYTSASYEEQDKFIFQILDRITDEASNLSGDDMPILFICSERRMKSEEILVKLFGIGIYNAIIGNDRSIDEVCRLINKPRTKKEAKLYYKIDTSNVNYEPESKDDVTEEEMQNILAHFRKIGKREDKYAESFANIVSQYNDKQMKVIVSILPWDVKAVLEENSPEYQKIVSQMRGTIKVNKLKDVQSQGPSEKLLNISENKDNLGSPIIVPSKLDKTLIKKVTKTKPKINVVDLLDDDDDEDKDDEIDLVDDFVEIEDLKPIEQVEEQKPVKRGRGRPRKNPLPDPSQEPAKPRKRGRPRKNPLPDETELKKGQTSLQDFEEIEFEPAKPSTAKFNLDQEERKRKVASFNDDDEASILPGFDDDDDDVMLPNIDDELDEMLPRLDNEKNDIDINEESNETILPGFDEEDDEDDDESILSEFEENEDENFSLPGFEEEENEDEDEVITPKFNNGSQYNYNARQESHQVSEVKSYDENYDYSNYSRLLSADKKVVVFVGTSKNGTSFIVNNVAKILATKGINTAIFDATKNRNSYYMYTDNDENLRQDAYRSVPNLINGIAQGINFENNLTVYTGVSSDLNQIKNAGPILETLATEYSAILIDADFDTPLDYFANAQEIYLVQSMDVLTIQPLTEFLRDLKSSNILEERKLKIIINKTVKIRDIAPIDIVGGMAHYNDPEMSFMTELFNEKLIKPIEVPFNSEVYASYLEQTATCKSTINRYPKEFMNILNNIASVVYPLMPATNEAKQKQKKKRGYQYETMNTYANNGFSNSVNNTLNNMKKRY